MLIENNDLRRVAALALISAGLLPAGPALAAADSFLKPIAFLDRIAAREGGAIRGKSGEYETQLKVERHIYLAGSGTERKKTYSYDITLWGPGRTERDRQFSRTYLWSSAWISRSKDLVANDPARPSITNQISPSLKPTVMRFQLNDEGDVTTLDSGYEEGGGKVVIRETTAFDPREMPGDPSALERFQRLDEQFTVEPQHTVTIEGSAAPEMKLSLELVYKSTNRTKPEIDLNPFADEILSFVPLRKTRKVAVKTDGQGRYSASFPTFLQTIFKTRYVLDRASFLVRKDEARFAPNVVELFFDQKTSYRPERYKRFFFSAQPNDHYTTVYPSLELDDGERVPGRILLPYQDGATSLHLDIVIDPAVGHMGGIVH